MGALTKTRQLLDFDMVTMDETTAIFKHGVEDGERCRSVLLMDIEDYKSLEKPRQITITIEPGDLLNDHGD